MLETKNQDIQTIAGNIFTSLQSETKPGIIKGGNALPPLTSIDYTVHTKKATIKTVTFKYA